MLNVFLSLGLFAALVLGIIFSMGDRRRSAPTRERAARMVGSSQGTKLLNQLDAHRGHGDLSRVVLRGGASAAYASAPAFEPVFLASGAGSLIDVSAPPAPAVELVRAGLADTSRKPADGFARGGGEIEMIVLNVEDDPVTVAAVGADSAAPAPSADVPAQTTAFATAETVSTAGHTWLPPLAAGH